MMFEISGLRAGYLKGADVLQGLSMTLERGQSVAIMGRNGMGKTTLMRSIVGHLQASAGSIRLNGTDLAGKAPYRIARAGIGYVPQGRDIFRDFTVEENLRMGLLGKPGLGSAVPPWAYAMLPILEERRTQRACMTIPTSSTAILPSDTGARMDLFCRSGWMRPAMC
jgi:ABC-type branched-subunit amino acid transport system ATPase component